MNRMENNASKGPVFLGIHVTYWIQGLMWLVCMYGFELYIQWSELGPGQELELANHGKAILKWSFPALVYVFVMHFVFRLMERRKNKKAL